MRKNKKSRQRDARRGAAEYPDSCRAFHVGRNAGAGPAFEWNPVSGRFYNVYWSSNLLDGFTLVGSHVPGGVFVDAGHAAEPEGFYKLTVEFEP